MSALLRVQVADWIAGGVRAAQAAGALPAFELPIVRVERPRQAEFGDYSSPVAMELARVARMAPRKIAEAIAAHLPEAPFAGRVEVAGAGFVNLTLDTGWLARQVDTVLAAGETWGQVDAGQGARVQVEFVSANPTGPTTIGSTRNAVIGDTLSNVLTAAGFDVQREYYVNDAGSQVRKFGESIFARYAQELGQDVPVPEGGYQGGYVNALAQEKVAAEGDTYLSLPRTEAVRTLGRWGIERMRQSVEADLSELRVAFDNWFFESSLHRSGLLERVLDMLAEKGLIVEHDGAVWFRFPDSDEEAVVIRSAAVIPEPEERPTYLASDIAYLWNKLVERDFERAIYIWGSDHHGDVPRVKAAARALGLDSERVEIILYQFVTLVRNGEEVRMSKRSGDFVALRDLLEEVGPDPIRFMLLTCTADTRITFDLGLAVEQSNENPVFYVQNAHVRCASIFRQMEARGVDVGHGDATLLQHPLELALIRKLIELPEVVAAAADMRAPHFLAFYALELARAFHPAYEECRILHSEVPPELRQARAKLFRAAQITLARVLHLMGMSAPERM